MCTFNTRNAVIRTHLRVALNVKLLNVLLHSCPLPHFVRTSGDNLMFIGPCIIVIVEE